MNNGSPTSKSPGRFASIALLVCLVYQLGACPCGCLEHNLWVEVLGISTGEHGHDVAHSDGDSDGISVADHHDCTGESRPQYVNTARDVSVGQVDDAIAHLCLATLASEHLLPPFDSREFHSTPPIARVHALSCPVTQVFRL